MHGLLVAATALLALVVTVPARAATSLLEGLSPSDSYAVRCTDCLNDGVAAREGGHWKTTLTSRFEDHTSFVDFDLGRERVLRGAWLQGDNNDSYELLVSLDGQHFTTGWRAGPVGEAGLRGRGSVALDLRARYVRLRPASGDGSFAVSELMLFEQAPAALPPPDLQRRSGIPLNDRMRHRALLFGLGMLGWVFLTWRGVARWWLVATALWPLITGYQFVQGFIDALPVGTREVSLVRGVVATAAAGAIIREAFGFLRREANRLATMGTLAACAVLGVLSFWNLGQPQFWHAKQGDWTFAHHLDLRQYYPTAKYFRELGYRGLYEADVAAYLEDTPRARPQAMARTPMRDLDTLQMTTVGEREWRIKTTKELFTPERWEEYKRDSAYFREAMGSHAFLDTMHDMGGNATPVWMSIAYLLFNAVPPTDTAFLYTALLDPLLLGIAFLAIGLTFGVKTALVSMVIFGANDFIMYGSNWGGATLRHDWMAYLAFGACALKRQRWMLGGAFFGFAAMIRAFPALAVIGASLPALWWLYGWIRQNRRLPRWSVIKTEQRHTLLIIAGAALSVAVLFAFSAIVLPVDAWVDWLAKVKTLTSDPHANHISLRSLIAGWSEEQPRILRARLPLFIAAIVFFVGAVIAASRGRRPEHTAMLALILIPVIFYPANYYIHFVFLLPLVVDEDRGALRLAPLAGLVFTLLLGMCAVQYFTVMVSDLGLHFYLASAILFATVTLLLGALLRGEAFAAFLALRPGELALAAGPAPAIAAIPAEPPAEPSVAPAEAPSLGGPASEPPDKHPADSGELPSAESEPERDEHAAKTGS